MMSRIISKALASATKVKFLSYSKGFLHNVAVARCFSVKTQTFCVKNDEFFSTNIRFGDIFSHHNKINNFKLLVTTGQERSFSSSEEAYYNVDKENILNKEHYFCGDCEIPQNGNFEDAEQMADDQWGMDEEGEYEYRGDQWGMDEEVEYEYGGDQWGMDEEVEYEYGGVRWVVRRRPRTWMSYAKLNPPYIGADVGEQFNLNTRNERQLGQSSQFPKRRGIEAQGCWWASVPIPPDLNLTPTDARPVDDGRYCAGKKKNLPGNGFYGGDGYLTLNAPRKMPNKFSTCCVLDHDMVYFNDDEDMGYFNDDDDFDNVYGGGHSNQSEANEHQEIQTANEDMEEQNSWWSSVPLSHMHSTPMDMKPIGDGDGYRYYKFECTVEQIDDLLFNNEVEEAVKVLKKLEKRKGIYVDLPRYLQLIRACGKKGTLQYGRDVYDNLVRSPTPIDVNTYNEILEMYSDCGSMFDAYEIFENKMPENNLRSWDIMIRGLAKNGHGEYAVDLFTHFIEAGLKPDGEMFMGVFQACSFLCDIETGMLHFDSMSKVYGIVPSMEHYVSVVNMLGSTGYLDEAMDFIERMPFEPDIDVWETLANLCRIHGNIKLGDHCSQIIKCLDPSRVKDKLNYGINCTRKNL